MAIVINGSGTVTGLAVGGLPDGTVDAGTLATNSVDSAELIDGAVDASHLASGVVKTNTPSFGVKTTSSEVALADNVYTKVTFDTEEFDNGGGFDLSNNKFVVPSGGAGDYIFIFNGVARDTSNALTSFVTAFYKNGSVTDQTTNTLISYVGGLGRNWEASSIFIDNLAESDYIEVFMNVNGNSDSSAKVENPRFTGFKLIE